MVGAQQLDRMAEADALAFITQSITEPPVRQAPRQCHRFFFGLTPATLAIVVERAQPEQVRPVPLSSIPALRPAAGDSLPLEPLDFLVGMRAIRFGLLFRVSPNLSRGSAILM